MGKVEVQNLHKRFGHKSESTVVALDGVSFEVDHGEFVSIVGPSGCGKSTLLYIVAGFVQADAGTVTVAGEPVTRPGTDRGIVFQEYGLFPWCTVLGNVMYGLDRSRMNKRERREVAQRHIDAIGLRGFENRYPRELSGGMKQRVAIARTLAYAPDVLLMDEPFGALDAQTRELMQDQLLQIWRDTGTTILLITHDVSEAVFLSQRVIVMKARPGQVKTEISVPFERTESRERTMLSEDFNHVRNEVWLAVREEVAPNVPSGVPE